MEKEEQRTVAREWTMVEGLSIGRRNHVATLTPQSGTHAEEIILPRKDGQCARNNTDAKCLTGIKRFGKIRTEELRAG